MTRFCCSVELISVDDQIRGVDSQTIGYGSGEAGFKSSTHESLSQHVVTDSMVSAL